MTAMRTIIRAATKKEDEPYNIIMMLDDEQSLPYVSNLCETQNKFYFWDGSSCSSGTSHRLSPLFRRST